MPGIVAIISRIPKDRAVEQLGRMVSTMCHEPSYTTGLLVDERLGVYVGWAELKESFSERMPLHNAENSVSLVFSGEDYRDPATVQELRAKGQDAGNSASYLVQLFQENEDFLRQLNGRFHGLALDRRRGQAVLFNDRYGMRRLYYYQSNDAFYVAAEAKAILAVCPELRKLNYRSVGEFISCGAVLEDRTVFEGINVLPPGSAWVFENAGLRHRGKYFEPSEWEQLERFDTERYYGHLRETFVRILPRYFEGKASIAMSLTGGLDTRMILANRESEPGSLPCYTFGSMYRDNHDVRVARRVAEVCKQPHEVITAGSEFLSRFSDYAERTVYLTDAGVDVSRAADLYLNERARAIAPVRMTGVYGGEILRGVRGFKPEPPLAGLFQPEFRSFIEQAETTYNGILCQNKISFAAFKQCPWYHRGVLSLEETQLTMRTPFLDNDLVQAVFRSPEREIASNNISLRLIEDGNRELRKIATDRGVGGNTTSLLGAVSRSTLEFTFKAEYAYDMGMPQWLSRVDHSLKAFHLERIFLGRHKPFHYRVWYRDSLAAYIKEMLLDPLALTRPYVSRKALEALVSAHVKGTRNYTNELHKLLTLEILNRLFLEGSERGGRSSTHDVYFTVA